MSGGVKCYQRLLVRAANGRRLKGSAFLSVVHPASQIQAMLDSAKVPCEPQFGWGCVELLRPNLQQVTDQEPLDGHVATTVCERINLQKDGKFQVQPPPPHRGTTWVVRYPYLLCATTRLQLPACEVRHIEIRP